VDLIFTSILGKSLLALGLHLTKEWLLSNSNGTRSEIRDTFTRVDVGEAHWRLLAISAGLLSIWHRPWEVFLQRINVCYPPMFMRPTGYS
jgi:hypothetical protein